MRARWPWNYGKAGNRLVHIFRAELISWLNGKVTLQFRIRVVSTGVGDGEEAGEERRASFFEFLSKKNTEKGAGKRTSFLPLFRYSFRADGVSVEGKFHLWDREVAAVPICQGFYVPLSGTGQFSLCSERIGFA